MSAPVFIFTFEYGEPKVTMSLRGESRIETRRKAKVALGWLPDDLRLIDVMEVPE